MLINYWLMYFYPCLLNSRKVKAFIYLSQKSKPECKAINYFGVQIIEDIKNRVYSSTAFLIQLCN